MNDLADQLDAAANSDGETIRANEDFSTGLRLGIAAQMGHLNSFDDDDTDLRDTWLLMHPVGV